MNDLLKIEFLVSATQLTKDEIADFELGLKITNDSNKVIAVDISDSELYVNSERSIAWDLAVQNGTIVNLKVSPWQTEIVMWPLGDAMFETSGVYELELVWKSFSASRKVTLNPE